jgi:DNA-3-methyladenine glycosylase
MTKLTTTTLLIRRGDPEHVLLGLKKRGFGAGKLQGPGGKIEPGETAEAGACREIAEEVGVQVSASDLLPAGHIEFVFPARPAWNEVVQLFVARQWEGEPTDSDELQPFWYPVEAIPYEQMWDDARLWLPHVLAGRRLKARIVFADDNEHVASHHLTVENNAPFGRELYAQHALVVARQLLGARLVRRFPDGSRISGTIVETEAYTGLDDMASHGKRRRTPRNTVMWDEPGHAYVYLSRGIHWMFNAVCEPLDQPAAVLIRALEPREGHDLIAARRAGRQPLEWTSGPARLAQALSITKAHNTLDLTACDGDLWIEPDQAVPNALLRTGPRIGMGKTPEPWYSIPWRFWVGGNPHVSCGSGKRG